MTVASGETLGWKDEKLEELQDLLTIIRLDCENGCFRATFVALQSPEKKPQVPLLQ